MWKTYNVSTTSWFGNRSHNSIIIILFGPFSIFSLICFSDRVECTRVFVTAFIVPEFNGLSFCITVFLELTDDMFIITVLEITFSDRLFTNLNKIFMKNHNGYYFDLQFLFLFGFHRCLWFQLGHFWLYLGLLVGLLKIQKLKIHSNTIHREKSVINVWISEFFLRRWERIVGLHQLLRLVWFQDHQYWVVYRLYPRF